MATLNRAGIAYAKSLIAAGKVNKTASWSFTADDGNKLLGANGDGADDWMNYGRHFLGMDASADPKTKDHWKYPFAKGETVYRSGLIAAKQRAAAEKDAAIENAASDMIDAIDKGKSAAELEHKEIVFELKADPNGEEGTITGYGSVFGNLDGGDDVVQAGAFSQSLNAWRAKGKMPKMLWQHDTRKPIGVWTNMQEDSKGLLVTGRFTKGVQQADEAYALLKDGALDGLSIGYRCLNDEYDTQNDIRTIKAADLLEVSIVTIPMNDMATISSVKSFSEAIDGFDTLSDAERFLREVGRPFSRKEATDFVSKVNRIVRREAGDDQEARAHVAALNRLAQALRG